MYGNDLTGISLLLMPALLLRTVGVIAAECLDKDVRELFIAELAKKCIIIFKGTEKF
jgi:hypothetical protein